MHNQEYSMNIRIKPAILLLLLILLIPYAGYAQYERVYTGPDDPAGTDLANRRGIFHGNRMYIYLQNNSCIFATESGGPAIWNKWPNLYDGFTLAHGITCVVTARVYIVDDHNPTNIDTIPETDLNAIQSSPDDYHVLYYAQQGWERADFNPEGTIEWGFKAVMDYQNPLSETMALSNDPDSWPQDGWPAKGNTKKWQGLWNGRYGAGIVKADLESFFVNNDAHDMEKLNVGDIDSVRYYPRPGLKIGDRNPDINIQKGLPWGGLGLRMEIRPYQWKNPQAQDISFFEYGVANLSEYNLPEVCFGYYMHPWIGEDHGMLGDDYVFFDKSIDMSYCWDEDGVGVGDIKTGPFGMAYLESPGAAFDGIDNDDDGLIDEKRDNTAGQKIGPYDGIADLQKFISFYHLTEAELHDHYEGDEDQDWMDGDDANGNGLYDNGENARDDVGLDGVAPGDLHYTGPDADGTECNHKPDYVEGIGCEPNFAATDVSESDMLGLTSFHVYDHETTPAVHQDDARYWEYFADPTFPSFEETYNYPGEWVNLFATGIFPLYKGRTERISLALLASYDPLEGLMATDHRAPTLFRKKEVAQIIYERDYQFAQPPLMPTLTVEAQDGRVVLTWDDVADKLTREPLLRRENDFEGYKLYKATDKAFLDAEIITDGYGTPSFRKPIFQCDVVDRKTGFTDFGLIEGMAYYLGEDTGIQHYFVDENVENGRTYYYALAAYDYGIPDLGDGVTPSENSIVLNLDEAEEIVDYGKNVAIVTPHQKAAGYVSPQLELLTQSFSASAGTVTPQLLSMNTVKENHTYKVKFSIDTIGIERKHINGIKYTTNGYYVYDETDNDRLVGAWYLTDDDSSKATINMTYIDTLYSYSLIPYTPFQTDVFEGMNLQMTLNTLRAQDGEIDWENSGWKTGNLSGNVAINITPCPLNIEYFPWDYEIVFGEPGVYTGTTTRTSRVKDENNRSIDESLLLLNQSFNFYVVNTTFTDAEGSFEKMDLIVHDIDSSGTFELATDRVLVGVTEEGKEDIIRTLFIINFARNSEMPEANDVYRLSFTRPFFITDSLTYRILPSVKADKNVISNNMDRIRVVPNPYVATNSMEPALANPYLNQRRRIMFTHLPAQCNIKIFTVSGVLVWDAEVNNPADNGIYHWDLKSKEGLEVAAGIYVYYVKAKKTGDEKIDKFAIIK
jgi:hypothetical protein